MERSDNEDSTPFLPLEHPIVPEWVLEKAKTELKETEGAKSEGLRKLKQKLQDEKLLNANLDDKFLIRFLRAKKFDLNLAFSLVKAYYNHRIIYPHIYEDYTASAVKDVAETNCFMYLPYRTQSGCPIMVSHFGQWKPDECSFQDVLRYGMLCNEVVVKNDITQICGVVGIVDLKGFGWRHVLNIGLKNIQCFISGVQDAFPLRQKEIHIVNNPAIFSGLFSLIKPFLNNKIKKRIFFHGSQMGNLHKYIPSEILPEEFGGELGPSDSREFYKLMVENDIAMKANSYYG